MPTDGLSRRLTREPSRAEAAAPVARTYGVMEAEYRRFGVPNRQWRLCRANGAAA